jgi:SAM-dependent methyltransferase
MNHAAEPYRKLVDTVNAFHAARALHVAVDLDLFSRLATTPKNAAQLAVLVGCDAHALERLLNALTALGFLHKSGECFQAAPVSQTYLVRGGLKYIGHFVQFQSRRWREWEGLGEVVRSGHAAREPNLYADSPADFEALIVGLHEIAVARGDARWLARAVPLTRCRKLLDVGGGAGTYAAAFCRENPDLEAVVLDLPVTLPVARRILKQFDTTRRVSFLACDYTREPITGGPYDVALLSNILHLHDAAGAVDLLRRIHAVLAPGGILIVKDYVMEAEHTQPASGALFALTLLLSTRGRTYTLPEMSQWIGRAGFHDTVVLAPEPPMTSSVLVALRAGPRTLALVPRPAARVAEDAADWRDPAHEEPPPRSPASTTRRAAARSRTPPKKKPAAAAPRPVRAAKPRRKAARPRGSHRHSRT